MRHLKHPTGGCQCGAVRYAWSEPFAYASVCHCRMCQKASGQPFMALAGGRLENLRWTRGQPTVFKSSDRGQRGFCAACGTPLTYRIEGSGRISIAIASLDQPDIVRPTVQYGVESKLAWTDGLPDLPAQRTEDWMRKDGVAPFVSCQHPDHDQP